MEQTLTAEMLLRKIDQADTELRWFEQKYSLRSETFYRLYEQGQLRGQDPARDSGVSGMVWLVRDLSKSSSTL